MSSTKKHKEAIDKLTGIADRLDDIADNMVVIEKQDELDAARAVNPPKPPDKNLRIVEYGNDEKWRHLLQVGKKVVFLGGIYRDVERPGEIVSRETGRVGVQLSSARGINLPGTVVSVPMDDVIRIIEG